MTPESLIPILRRPLADLPRELVLCPVPGAFAVSVRPPGSKSLTNRALLLASLAEGESALRGCLLDADDAKVMIEALRRLGASIEVRADATWGNEVRVRGVGGRFRVGADGQEINLLNAGTATRFLAAAACLGDGPVVIDGNARMRQRPIAELLDLLRRLGVRVDELGEPGRVPLRVHPCRPKGGAIDVGVTQSSQYVSALLLIAPWMEKGLEARFAAAPTSPSYIDMTLRLLRGVGAGTAVRDEAWRRARVSHRGGGGLSGFVAEIEPDASGATYFWGAAAVAPGASATVEGLPEDSMQGDAWFKALLCRMGAGLGEGSPGPEDAGAPRHDDARALIGRTLTAVDVDLTLMPDTAMTAAAVSCFTAPGAPTTLRGLRTLRVKETDRLAALQNELRKVGVGVEIEGYTADTGVADELLRITPSRGGIDCAPDARPVVFDTYDDHRMAMSLAIIGLRRPNVVIRDPACVAKTYPGFWADWARIYEGASGTGRTAPGRDT